MTALHQAAQKAVEVAGIFRTFTKSSHRFHDGQPLHLVAAELLETLAALQHQEVPREPVAWDFIRWRRELVYLIQDHYESSTAAKHRTMEAITEHVAAVGMHWQAIAHLRAMERAASPSTTQQQEAGSGVPVLVHIAHCYQGECPISCKYGDNDCPAAPSTPAREEAGLPAVDSQTNPPADADGGGHG